MVCSSAKAYIQFKLIERKKFALRCLARLHKIWRERERREGGEKSATSSVSFKSV